MAHPRRGRGPGVGGQGRGGGPAAHGRAPQRGPEGVPGKSDADWQGEVGGGRQAGGGKRVEVAPPEGGGEERAAKKGCPASGGKGGRSASHLTLNSTKLNQRPPPALGAATAPQETAPQLPLVGQHQQPPPPLLGPVLRNLELPVQSCDGEAGPPILCRPQGHPDHHSRISKAHLVGLPPRTPDPIEFKSVHVPRTGPHALPPAAACGRAARIVAWRMEDEG